MISVHHVDMGQQLAMFREHLKIPSERLSQFPPEFRQQLVDLLSQSGHIVDDSVEAEAVEGESDGDVSETVAGRTSDPKGVIPRMTVKTRCTAVGQICPLCGVKFQRVAPHMRSVHQIDMGKQLEMFRSHMKVSSESLTQFPPDCRQQLLELLRQSGHIVSDPVERDAAELEADRSEETVLADDSSILDEESGESDAEDVASDDSDENDDREAELPSISVDPISSWKLSVESRIEMREKGMYRRLKAEQFPVVGKDFKRFLDQRVESKEKFRKRQVGIVCQILYGQLRLCKASPRKLKTLTSARDFVADNQDSFLCYIDELIQCKTSASNVKNYLKAYQRFVKFLKHTSRVKDCNVLIHLDGLLSILGDRVKVQQKVMNEKRGKDAAEAAPQAPFEEMIKFLQNRKVKRMIEIILRTNPTSLCETEYLFLLRYLICAVVCKTGQRPEVAENFTLDQFRSVQTVTDEESGVICNVFPVVKTKVHNGRGHQFVVGEEDFKLLQYYCDFPRNQFRDKMDDKLRGTANEPFFISTVGTPVRPSESVIDIQLKNLKLPGAFRAIEIRSALITTAHNSGLSPLELSHLATTQNHSFDTQVDQYRRQKTAIVVSTFVKILELSGIRGKRNSTPESTTPPKRRRMTVDTSAEVAEAVQTPDETPDEIIVAVEDADMGDGVGDDGDDGEMSSGEGQPQTSTPTGDPVDFVQHMVDTSVTPPPIQVEQVKKRKSKNVADWAERIGYTASDFPTLLELSKYQSWKHLKAVELGKYGKGMFAEQNIRKGTVTVDYDGEWFSLNDYETYEEKLSELEKSHVRDYLMETPDHKDGNQKWFVTSHNAGSPERMGRLINHSRKHPNLSRLMRYIGEKGNAQKMILFVASKDILVGEQLLYDYGVGMKDRWYYDTCLCAECKGVCWCSICGGQREHMDPTPVTSAPFACDSQSTSSSSTVERSLKAVLRRFCLPGQSNTPFLHPNLRDPSEETAERRHCDLTKSVKFQLERNAGKPDGLCAVRGMAESLIICKAEKPLRKELVKSVLNTLLTYSKDNCWFSLNEVLLYFLSRRPFTPFVILNCQRFEPTRVYSYGASECDPQNVAVVALDGASGNHFTYACAPDATGAYPIRNPIDFDRPILCENYSLADVEEVRINVAKLQEDERNNYLSLSEEDRAKQQISEGYFNPEIPMHLKVWTEMYPETDEPKGKGTKKVKATSSGFAS